MESEAVPAVRRSSRANKGQHHMVDMVRFTEAPLRKRARPDGDSDEDARVESDASSQFSDSGDDTGAVLDPEDAEYGDEEDNGVRCLVCGTTDANYNEATDEEPMACCDGCHTWQHLKCMFGHLDPDRAPAHYLCNVCDPGNKQYLALQYAIDPAPYVAQRKAEVAAARAKAAAAEAETEKTRAARRELKLVQRLGRKAKRTGAAAGALAGQEAAHRAAVTKQFGAVLAAGGAEAGLASVLEETLHAACADHPSYLAKARLMVANLKNPRLGLVARVVGGGLLVERLVQMRPEDMRLVEMAEEVEKMRQRAMAQSVLKPDEDDRVTAGEYEGEVESATNPLSQSHGVPVRTPTPPPAAAAVLPAGPRNAQLQPFVHVPYDDDDEGVLGAAYNLTDGLDEIVGDSSGGPARARDRLPEYDPMARAKPTHNPAPGPRASVSEPSTEQEAEYDPMAAFGGSSLAPAAGAGSLDPVDWTGTLLFPGVVLVAVRGAVVGSTVEQLRLREVRRGLLPQPHYEIAGRLELATADKYLQLVVAARELYMVELVPQSDSGAGAYRELWEYLSSRNRYGVVKNRQSWVKDTYVVPARGGVAGWGDALVAVRRDRAFAEGEVLYMVVVARKPSPAPRRASVAAAPAGVRLSGAPDLADVLSKLSGMVGK